MDSLEGAMEAWTEAPLSDLHTHASYIPAVDIVNYLETKKTHQRAFASKAAIGQNIQRGQKPFYGFHGDDSPPLARYRPRRVDPIEHRAARGGWDDCTIIAKISPQRERVPFAPQNGGVAGAQVISSNNNSRSVTAPPRKLPPMDKRPAPRPEGLVARSAPPQPPDSRHLPPLGVARGTAEWRGHKLSHAKQGAAVNTSPRTFLLTSSGGGGQVVPVPFVMDYAARLRQLRAEIEAAMSSLADSRAERSQLQKKVQSLESELKRKQELAAARKRELLEYDKAKRRIRAASSKVTQLVQQLRRKELKVADLRRMVAGNKKRLAAVEKEDMEAAARLPPHLKTLSSSFEGAAANEVGEEPAPVSEEVKQKALVKRCAALKLQLDKLVAQGKSLQKEHGHLAKKVKDVETKRQLQQQKVLKQQQALALEAQRKAQHQLETEAAHLRDNHIKGLRHREREHQARLQEEEACRQQVVTRITAAVSASQILVKELAELKSRHSCLVTTMDEADRRNRERQVELETKATEWKLLLAVVSEKKKKLSGIEYEQQVAQEKLSAAESFTRADAANDKERQQLLKKIADAATQQQIIAKATNDLEESIAKVKAQRVVSLASSTLPAHIAELQRSILSLQGQLEQEKKDQAAEAAKRSKELRETQTTQAQMDLKLDRRIEELTQQHTSHRSELAAHNARNTALLEELDQKERLVAMHNFGNKQ